MVVYVNELNHCHPTIKLDYEIREDEVNFLDTTVYKDKNGKLRTKLYRKPTDRQNYLHLKSEHPPSLKKSIPYSQALRIRKICHDEKYFNENCEKLAATFKNRGYQEDFINQQIIKAAGVARKQLLKEKKTSKL